MITQFTIKEPGEAGNVLKLTLHEDSPFEIRIESDKTTLSFECVRPQLTQLMHFINIVLETT